MSRFSRLILSFDMLKRVKKGAYATRVKTPLSKEQRKLSNKAVQINITAVF
jgi:hypothetical protein